MNNSYIKYIGENGFNYSVNVSLGHKYIYVETPKVASTTIKYALYKIELNCDKVVVDNIHDRAFFPALNPHQVGCFDDFLQHNPFFVKFCFVRNPYHRLLSVYLDKIQRNCIEKKKILVQMGLDLNKVETFVSFDDFVKAVVRQPISFMDPHWRIQYYQTLQGQIDYDFIGKLETFDTDFKYILKKIGVMNASKYMQKYTKHETGSYKFISKYYNEELRDLVYSKYKKDFDYFNYDTKLLDISNNEPKLQNIDIFDNEKMQEISSKLYNLEGSRPSN